MLSNIADWPKATSQDVRYAVTCLLRTLLSGDNTTSGIQGVTLRPLLVGALSTTSEAKADQFRIKDATAEQPLDEKVARVVFHGNMKIVFIGTMVIVCWFSVAVVCGLLSITVLHVGLKIIVACFEKQLSSHWHRIASAIKQFSKKPYSGK